MQAFDSKVGVSANNADAVTLSCEPSQFHHTVAVTVNGGNPTGGTFSIKMDGQTIDATISATALSPVVGTGHCSSITVTPAGLDAGLTYSVRHTGTL